MSFRIRFFHRRKLDSIITKLHQVTTLGSESHGEEDNPVKCLFCDHLLREQCHLVGIHMYFDDEFVTID